MGRSNMLSMGRWFGLAALAAGFAGCATPVTQRVSVDSSARAEEERTQKRLVIQSAFQMEKRLWNVGYSVLKGAASECGDVVRPGLGLRAAMKGDSGALVADALGLDNSLRVVAVYKGSAAEAAGFRNGDVLVSGDAAIQKPVDETREAARKRLSGTVTLGVLRDGSPLSLSVTPDTVCDYPLEVSSGSEVNAYADGKKIVVTKGMMRFAAEDRELALILGHELGHNTMGHITKKKQNMAVGAVFDVLAAAYGVNTQSGIMKAGSTAYTQDFESEADYVGMYYLARAGYETDGAADFWRRMAIENPANIKTNHAASHPATTERFLALAKVGAEVREKQAGGSELVPNRVK